MTAPTASGVIDYDNGIVAVDTVYDGQAMQTASHLIIEAGRAAVVDTGTAHATPRILAALADRGIPPDRVDYVVLTHVHLDHAGGAGTLMAACPNACLTVHPRGARHMIDPGRLHAATAAIYGEAQTRRVYGELMPVDPRRVIETAEGTQLELAGRRLDFIDAPGHARHHVVMRDGRTGHLFAGDCFGVSYRALDRDGLQFVFPTTSPSQFDPPALLKTIDRMMAGAPKAIYLTHFGEVRDVGRLADDLKRLIAGHVSLAEACAAAGAERHACLKQGVATLLRQEAARQRWPVSAAALDELFSFDVELNAQGLGVWIDAGNP